MTLSALDYWKLVNHLSVMDASILATGNDPSLKSQDFDGKPYQRTDHIGFEATFKGIKSAIINNEINANIAYKSIYLSDSPDWDEIPHNSISIDGIKYTRFNTFCGKKTDKLILKGSGLPQNSDLYVLVDEPDWSETTVEVEELKRWFRLRGFKPPFFFPAGDPDSLNNSQHPRYAPKLACAVAAWETLKKAAPKRSVKQTIEAWVRSNGVIYGVKDVSGIVPEAAVEDIAKVVNWRPEGGAAKTGGEVEETFPSEPPDNFEAWGEFGTGRRDRIDGAGTFDGFGGGPTPRKSPFDDDIPF